MNAAVISRHAVSLHLFSLHEGLGRLIFLLFQLDDLHRQEIINMTGKKSQNLTNLDRPCEVKGRKKPRRADFRPFLTSKQRPKINPPI